MANKKVKPIKKSSKKTNVEVKNSHKAKQKKKIQFVKPEKKQKQPKVYDEAKYLKKRRRQSKKNILYIVILFLLLFMLCILFVIKLQITHTKNGNNLQTYAQNAYTETTNIESNRGTIYDSNGEALAINLEVYDLRAVTARDFECNVDGQYENCALEDPSEAAKQMASALNLDSEAENYIKDRLEYGIENGKYEVTFGTQGSNITLSEKKALESLEYPWLQFDPQEMRFYPYGDFASYVIGYTTKDDETDEITGALGVEKALDGHLKGQDGMEISLFDNYGIELTEAQQSAIPKIDGTNVYLTIDSVIQTFLENSMEKALANETFKNLEYEGLFTIVMDVNSGDILAAQSYPTFDPNVREIDNYTNYFANYCYEPGSTFKTLTVAAALEAGVWSDTKTVPSGSRSASTWGGATIKDWNNGVGWGNMTYAQGYYLSANTVMTYIMDEFSNEFWNDFITNKLLIGTPVKTQFFETPSCVFNPKYDLEYATTSFGQGMTVNALQLLRAYSALVGDGNMVTPHIVKEIRDPETDEVIYSDDDLEVVTDVVSESTSQKVVELMRGSVTYEGPAPGKSDDGLGYYYADSDYDIGLKTGTAQMAGDNGKYEAGKYLYSTMAVAPVEDPQILVYTAVIDPNIGSVSTAAFPQYVMEVVDNSLSYLNSENRQIDIDEDTNELKVKKYVGKDISNIEDKSVIKLGSGEITVQYPKPGQHVASDQRVVLIGSEEVSFPDVVGYTYNETVAVCNALNVTCEFSNSGTRVKSVTSEDDEKYKIKME